MTDEAFVIKCGDYLLTDGVATICRIIKRGLASCFDHVLSLLCPFCKPFTKNRLQATAEEEEEVLAGFTLSQAALSHRLLELPFEWTAFFWPCLPIVCSLHSGQSDPVKMLVRSQSSLTQSKSQNLPSLQGPS